MHYTNIPLSKKETTVAQKNPTITQSLYTNADY